MENAILTVEDLALPIPTVSTAIPAKLLIWIVHPVSIMVVTGVHPTDSACLSHWEWNFGPHSKVWDEPKSRLAIVQKNGLPHAKAMTTTTMSSRILSTVLNNGSTDC